MYSGTFVDNYYIISHVICCWRGYLIHDEYQHHGDCLWCLFSSQNLGLGWAKTCIESILWWIRNVTDCIDPWWLWLKCLRLNLWRLIHNVMRNRHKYCFMLVFQQSVMKIYCHTVCFWLLASRRLPLQAFFFWDHTVHIWHSKRTHTHTLWIHVRKPYPYDHLRRLSRQILEIDEVTTGASLSTGTSTTTECTMPLNPRILAPMESRTQDLRCYRGSCNH